jgi:hypothetical protein
MTHTRLVQLRVPGREAATWRRAAAEEDRSLSAMIRIAVREHLRARTKATTGAEEAAARCAMTG